MNEVFTIDKEFLFKSNIYEVTSISIEHNYDINGTNCEGEFIVSGDYRLHEVSINREDFSFRIPFKNEIRSNINLDSIEVEITDFTYTFNADELNIHIEYLVSGEQALIEFAEETDLEEFLKTNNAEVIDLTEEVPEVEERVEAPARAEEKTEENLSHVLTSGPNAEPKIFEAELAHETEINPKEKIFPEIFDDFKETPKTMPSYESVVMPKPEQIQVPPYVNYNNNEMKPEYKPEPVQVPPYVNYYNNEMKPEYKPETKEDKKDDGINKDDIINSINAEENFITYHVHTVISSDTIESICSTYNISLNELKKFNNIDELSMNMKLIIPDEEN